MIKSIQLLVKNSNENLFVYGCICLVAAMGCFILTRYSAVKVMEVNAWIKPLKFFLSIALFAFTMAVYVSFITNERQVHMYSWSFIVFLSIEVSMITIQAARGKQSHFNTETLLDNIIFAIMGLAIFAIVVHTFYIAILFFIQKQFALREEMALAIQVSFIIMVLFALEGFAMVSLHKHTIGGEDASTGVPLLGWSKNIGDLRVAHFLGIHALQIIPIMCYFFARSKREVIFISCIYFVFVTYTLLQAIQGKPLLKL